MADEERNSSSANSLQNGKSFSISSILAIEAGEKETTGNKDNDRPAVVSKIGFPSMETTKPFSVRPEGAATFPASHLSSLPAWYQWYTAGHHFLQQLHQEKLSRECVLLIINDFYLYDLLFVKYSPSEKKEIAGNYSTCVMPKSMFKLHE